MIINFILLTQFVKKILDNSLAFRYKALLHKYRTFIVQIEFLLFLGRFSRTILVPCKD